MAIDPSSFTLVKAGIHWEAMLYDGISTYETVSGDLDLNTGNYDVVADPTGTLTAIRNAGGMIGTGQPHEGWTIEFVKTWKTFTANQGS